MHTEENKANEENSTLEQQKNEKLVQSETKEEKKSKNSLITNVLTFSALGLSCYSAYLLYTTVNNIDYDKHFIKTVNNLNVAETTEEIPMAETNKTPLEPMLNIVSKNGKMNVTGQVLLQHKIVDNTNIPEISESVISEETTPTTNSEETKEEVLKVETIEEKETIGFTLSENNLTIDYKTNADIIVLNDYITVKAINSENILSEGITVLDTDNKTQIVAMSKKLSDKTGLMLVAEHNDNTQIELAKKVAENIFDSSTIVSNETKQNITFNDIKISETWLNNVTIITNVVELSREDGEKIYLSNFANSLTGAGMTSNAALTEKVNLKFNPSIKDSATGYIPFMYTDNNGTVKILAKSTEDIKTIEKIEIVVEENVVEGV